nr:immunoglobulin heavy chain junction region [Mus musculus]NSM08162.1 immunoglobulin heavy chain junction region [Mus musculus]
CARHEDYYGSRGWYFDVW